MSIKLSEFALKYGIKLKHLANYYPQGNGLDESTNKNLVNIIKKTVNKNPRNWHAKIPFALCADRITPKASIKNSHFFLVYGQEAILPTHIFLPSLQLFQYVQVAECPIMQRWINTLLQLEEECNATQKHFKKHQQIVKSWFEKKFVGKKYFNLGDLVLKWDKLNEMKDKHSMF